MNWTIVFLEEAKNDIKKLDGSVKPQVLKGIQKVSQNPFESRRKKYGL